jgi:dienelactone hydrolase
MMDDPKTRAAFDAAAFAERNSKTTRFPEILECATALKEQYEKVRAISFCYGGWAVFKIAARGQNLLHCVSTAHPSFIDEQEIISLDMPTQILAPEHDHHLTPELKDYCNRVIPGNHLSYEYAYFPGVARGFATRYDQSDKYQKASFERAKRSAVNWLDFWLH